MIKRDNGFWQFSTGRHKEKIGGNKL